MKSLKRFPAMLLVAALLIPAGAPAENPEKKAPEETIPQEEEIPEDEWLAAEQEEHEYPIVSVKQCIRLIF